MRGEKDVALNEYLTAYRFNDKDVDLIETIAALLEAEGDKTKASEFYERLADVDPKNRLALEKLQSLENQSAIIMVQLSIWNG